MKNSYTVTVIFNECSSGQNWIECFSKIDRAVVELTEHLVAKNGRYTQGRYDEEEDEFIDNNLYFDYDGDVIFDTEKPHNFLGQSWCCGDYTVTFGKI